MSRYDDEVSRHHDEDYDRTVEEEAAARTRAFDRTLSGEGLLAKYTGSTRTTTPTRVSTPQPRVERGTFVRSDPERVAEVLEEFAWACRVLYRSETLAEAIRKNREFEEHRERVLADVDSFLQPSHWKEFVHGSVSALDYDDVRFESAEGRLLDRAETVREEC